MKPVYRLFVLLLILLLSADQSGMGDNLDKQRTAIHAERDKFTSKVKSLEEKIGEVSLKNILAEFESDVIDQALRKSRGSVVQASRDLQVGKTALYDKMKRYDISAKSIKRTSAR